MGKKCFTSLLLISAFLLMVLLTACNDTPTGTVASTATLTPIEKTAVSSATSTAITQFTPKINATPTPTYQYYDGTTVKTGPDPTGKIIFTKDGGLTWTELYSESPENHFLSQITCPTTRVCYALLSLKSVLLTEDGGVTWQLRPIFSGLSLPYLECPSTTICFAVGTSDRGGTDIQMTTNSSKTWKSIKDANYYKAFEAFQGFACATPVNCIATGRLSLRTDDGGKSWQPVGGLDDDSAATSLSCPAINICFGAGGSNKPKYRAEGNGYIASTTDAGKTWNNQFFDDVPGGFSSLSCPDIRVCYAVGHDPNSKSNILATKDGGQNWIRQPFNPDTPTGLTKIACTDVTNCIAIGYEVSRPYYSPAIVVTKDGGNTWIKQTPNSWKQKDTLLDVSCPATNACFAILQAA